jgi:hypothetical protein
VKDSIHFGRKNYLLSCQPGLIGVETAERNLPPSIFLKIKIESSGIELYPATEILI